VGDGGGEMEDLGVTVQKSCRLCGHDRLLPVLDLGAMPPANALREPGVPASAEIAYPLAALRCPVCSLVQLSHVVDPRGIFDDYPYFSSFSDAWVDHARRFAAAATARLGLGPDSRVVEVASNDGYLLKWFVAAGIPALGIEPSGNVAAAALAAGIPTEVRFFHAQTARDLAGRGLTADLIVANNVLAHVPDLHDFVAGFPVLLRPGGRISLEFPHLLRLLQGVEFDTIYHEHFSYFSFAAIERLLARHGLLVVDVEDLSTHGGSLRVWAGRDGTASAAVGRLRRIEAEAGLESAAPYDRFAAAVTTCRQALRDFLDGAAAAGKRVAAYGAAAKGATLLNSCGIGPDRVAFVADRNPRKQGRFMPGSAIPVAGPERIFVDRPDYVLILPWNLADEIAAQLAGIAAWGGRLVVPVPKVKVLG
jgi:SAM-dependent methyltransferase